MSFDVNCGMCHAAVGSCIDCGGCFLKHCQCDPCQHGHPRAEIAECPFCRPTPRGPDEERDIRITQAQQERLDEDDELEQFAEQVLETRKAEAIDDIQQREAWEQVVEDES